MKTHAIIAFAVLVSLGRGAPRPETVANEQAKLAATELFRARNSAAALAHLRSNLRPKPGPDGATSGLVQNLIEITCTLYNRRELTLARSVLVEALNAAGPVLDRRSAVPAARGSELACSLGVLSERVLLDQPRAAALYDTAAALNPANRLNQDRKNAVLEKQKPRGKSGGS